MKQRIEQAEASVMAEERQAQMSFNWARIGFSVALMVQVGLSAGCFPAASVYGGPPVTPSPRQSAATVPASPSAQPLQSTSPNPQLRPVERPQVEVYGAPPRPHQTPVGQPPMIKRPAPEGQLTPVDDPPRKVYGMPRNMRTPGQK